VIAVLAFIALACFWVFRPSTQISASSYNKIALGMTEKEIQSIIGLPPGDYYKGCRNGQSLAMDRGPWLTLLTEEKLPQNLFDAEKIEWSSWFGTRYDVTVAFQDGRAVWKLLRHVNHPTSDDRIEYIQDLLSF
jgi:hypothetical protein